MSVINQMLRDLDQRGNTSGEPAMRQGTLRVAPPPAAPRPATASSARWAAAVLVVLVLLALAVWQWGGWELARSPTAAPEPSPSSPLAADAKAGGSADSPATSTPPASTAPAPAHASADAATLPMSLRLDMEMEHVPKLPSAVRPAQPMVSPSPLTAVPAAGNKAAAPTQVASAAGSGVPPAAKVEPRADATVAAPGHSASAPMPASPAVTAASTAGTLDASAQMQRQLAGARDALAHAQGLWVQGQQAAALDLLRDALQVAERDRAPGMDGAVTSLVRELARMLLAQGRVQEAHETLVRSEGRTRGNPEVWALRGNVAQRLGLHADSVLAYMHALEARPSEQRWLLGLAVSLAAQGQMQPAQAVLEKARNEGPIARDIADYLRKMGLTVR